MLSFLSRRYMHPIEEVGATERILGVVILLLTGGIVATFVVQTLAVIPKSPSPPSAMEHGFPELGLAGWRAPVRVFHYSPQNLYTKINGRAPAYIDAGVVALWFGTYSFDADPRRTIDVYWYDLAAPVSAATMFRAESVPGAAVLAIGDQAYQTGGAVFFRKRAAYVQVLPTGFDEADADIARSIAERIADTIVDRERGGGEPGRDE